VNNIHTLKGVVNMTNVELIMEEIKRCQLSKTAIAAEWGMSMPTFYSRISGKSEFTASEIVAATKTFNLTRSRRDQIFLTESVN
jgi:hypothetical protein